MDYSMVNEIENPFSELPDVYNALDYMGINYIETTNCEADDMIASYVLSFCDNFNIVICSFDRDFFPLISERISVLRYRGKNTMWCSSQYIIEKNWHKNGSFAFKDIWNTGKYYLFLIFRFVESRNENTDFIIALMQDKNLFAKEMGNKKWFVK